MLLAFLMAYRSMAFIFAGYAFAVSVRRERAAFAAIGERPPIIAYTLLVIFSLVICWIWPWFVFRKTSFIYDE